MTFARERFALSGFATTGGFDAVFLAATFSTDFLTAFFGTALARFTPFAFAGLRSGFGEEAIGMGALTLSQQKAAALRSARCAHLRVTARDIENVILRCKRSCASLEGWRVTSYVLKKTNQMIASTKIAATVLTASSARTDGPGSACRASVGVSTIRRWPSACSTFAIASSFMRMRETARASYEGQRPMADEVPDRTDAAACMSLGHNSGACHNPTAGA